MATGEAYMLSRNREESQRLDAQHHFSRALAHGHLIQPTIPLAGLCNIADIGCGTGIWLREAAQELGRPRSFTGFDISAQQFPKETIQGVDFIVHDAVEPFPLQYHGSFDIVNVRLLSYALKAQDLGKAVENIISILRPGGYLQWQEFDAIDSWAVPDTLNARSTIAYIVSERIARGLTPAIASPLVKAMQSIHAPIPLGMVDPISWTGDLVRLIHLETISTMNHPSRAVEVGKKQGIMGAALQLLQAGISRRQTLATEARYSGSQVEKLEEEVEDMKRLVEAWKQGGDPACNHWDCTMTSVVARKALLINEHAGWMTNKC